MAPQPQAPGLIQVVVNYAGPDGAMAINRYYVSCGTQAIDQTGITYIANQFFLAVLGTGAHQGLINHLSSEWSLVSVEATDLNGGLIGISTHAAVAGPDATTAFSPNVAVCISWKAAGRYRGGHFRSYMCGYGSGNAATPGGRHITSSAASDIVLGATWFIQQVNAIQPVNPGSVTLVGVHRTHTPVKGQPPVVYNPPLVVPITAALVDTRLDSQRRRLGKPPAA